MVLEVKCGFSVIILCSVSLLVNRWCSRFICCCFSV